MESTTRQNKILGITEKPYMTFNLIQQHEITLFISLWKLPQENIFDKIIHNKKIIENADCQQNTDFEIIILIAVNE